jgi:cytochrome c oxidase cbb3-type subunit 3/ubiquinol-cytochrome c reductase cytochrome c subunit
MDANRRQLIATALIALAGLAVGAPRCDEPVLTHQEEQGRQLYTQMCAVCHGANGEGYKADAAPAIGNPAYLAAASDKFLKGAIADGRRNTTMSAWSTPRGGPLTPARIDAVVAYMRRWGRADVARLDELQPMGDPVHGAQLYAQECVRCHGAHGTEGPNVHIGSPQLLASASNGLLRDAIRNGRAPTTMEPYIDKLGHAGVEDVVALLRLWQSGAAPLPTLPPARPAPLPLGPVPLHPKGPDPVGFRTQPLTTPADVIKAQLDKGAKMALLDARTPSDYTAEHIAGAVSVPFYDPAPYLDKLPKDAWLVCYCACPHAESGQLAQKLVSSGFTKVTVLDEGLGVWKNRKYGVASGTTP